jgi:hypothetical protein
MKYKILILLSFLLMHAAHAQDAGIQNAADIRLALEKLNTLGSVLYVGAHPDDENTGIIAYWAKEKNIVPHISPSPAATAGKTSLGPKRAAT